MTLGKSLKISAILRYSYLVITLPQGLLGELRIINLVLLVNAALKSS